MRRASIVMYGLALLLLVDVIVVTWLYPEERDALFWTNLTCTFGAFTVGSIWAAYRLQRGRGYGLAITLLSIMLGMTVIGALLTVFVHRPKGETGRPVWAERTVHVLRTSTGAYLLFAFAYVIRDSVRRPERQMLDAGRSEVRGAS